MKPPQPERPGRATRPKEATPPRPAPAVAPVAASGPDPGPAPPDRLGGWLDGGLLVLFLALVALLGAFPVLDTDFWWHLRTGDLIRQTGAVPRVDPFTFGAEGHRWTDLHWIFQLLCSYGFERAGVVGLNVGKIALTTLAVALLVTSGRRDWPAWATLLAWVPALLVLSGRMYLRPETLTLLYLAADLAILARWDRRPRLAFLLPAVQLLWVNSQGLFVFGPMLVAGAMVDAALRPGAFAPARRPWWRVVMWSGLLTVVACLLNPYGTRGATYPIELLGTMGGDLFRKSIAELKPIPTLFGEAGFNLLPLNVHFAAMGLGILSFAAPTWWRLVVAHEDRREGITLAPPAAARPLRWLRLALLAMALGLGLTANRNSHQFAALIGTITAWNLAEWAAEVAARVDRRRQHRGLAPVSTTLRRRLGPRLLTASVLLAMLGLIGSGKYYEWCGEGRTIGLGEEPYWYPHAAIRFAGGPGMPERNVGYHNGHPALFEYYWGPGKKTYTDARLEVMGPELYGEYLNLERAIAANGGNWAETLDRLGRPSVVVDMVHPDDGVGATLLLSRHWCCVYFDAIAAVFVHDSLAGVVREHGVDFLARHYAGEADAAPGDRAGLFTMIRALRGLATSTSQRNGEAVSWATGALALDYARRIRRDYPDALDGPKQAGLTDFLRCPSLGEAAIPRFRLPFDPTIDLPLVRATAELTRATEIEPNDRIVLWELALLAQTRGLDEEAIAWLERFRRQPTTNIQQQNLVAATTEQIAQLRRRLGPEPGPATRRPDRAGLDAAYERLARGGRAALAVEVAEATLPPSARPWAWADRLATVRLHLGRPDLARALWQGAKDAPPALQLARVALTHHVEGDDDRARALFRQAAATDPGLFEAHFGLASLEQRLGHADAAVAAARLAERTAPGDRARAQARQILDEAAPYARAAPPGAKP